MPVLTLTSYVFYGWTNPWFVLLILWSTLVDFCCGNLIYGHWRLIGRSGMTPMANRLPRTPSEKSSWRFR